MELLEVYSNRTHELGKLRKLLNLPKAARPEPRHPTKQAQKRLAPDEVAELLRAYQAGGRTKQLAIQFGVHRTTVTGLLKQHDVSFRPPGLGPADLSEAIRLYEAGWSLARLGQHFGVTGHNTISDALRRAGVSIRPRRGSSSSGASLS